MPISHAMARHDPPADRFVTSDLGVASFLSALDLPLLGIEEAGDRAHFVFPGSAESTAARFYHAGVNVNARRFHQCLRELRGLARRKER
jgi:hypothetical protein